MKHLKIAVLAVLLTFGFSNVNAQDENNPWQIGFGVNAVDFFPTNPNTTWGGSWYNEFANAKDHYNMIPAITKITVSKYLADGFSFEAAGSLNKIDKIGNKAASDLSYFAIDGAVKYDINNVIGETAWFDPYLTVGGGYTWMSDWDTGTANGGAGFNVWFNDNIGLNIETKYKHTFESNIPQHWQHSAGIVIKFGGTDTDGDGVFDKNDACPDVFGLKEFNGCPDTDADDIVDSKDACPNVAGLAELNGCPDADADGIADKDDACPNAKGTKANKGCPDTDGDGVTDASDKCPNVAGPKANNGCPYTDKDKDGVLDKDDKCPNVAGIASNNGCPEVKEVITKEAEAQLSNFARTILFNSSRASFKGGVTSKLDAIAKIMGDYPNADFAVEGHTDSQGPAAFNLKLSEKRAIAVRDYLVKKGIATSRLTATGFGEGSPIDTNATKSGRANNRRVEIKVTN